MFLRQKLNTLMQTIVKVYSVSQKSHPLLFSLFMEIDRFALGESLYNEIRSF